MGLEGLSFEYVKEKLGPLMAVAEEMERKGKEAAKVKGIAALDFWHDDWPFAYYQGILKVLVGDDKRAIFLANKYYTAKTGSKTYRPQNNDRVKEETIEMILEELKGGKTLEQQDALKREARSDQSDASGAGSRGQ